MIPIKVLNSKLILIDKSCLVPMTQSLYVKGVMSDVKNVMVDVGTGYYVDMDVASANDFYSRKIGLLKENMDSLEITINTKQDQRGSVVEIMQTKLQLIQKESQAAREKSAAERE